MPRVVKYSTTSLDSTLRKGDMVLGINDVDYGTGFYSTVEPPSGGYTIYMNKPSGGPSVVTAETEADLINITRDASGITFDNTQQCLQWFSSQTDKIVVGAGDRIGNMVTDGLVGYLEPGLLMTYPTTGSTMYGLANTNISGSILNGVSYNTNGYFTFDGTDDRIRVTPNPVWNFSGSMTINFLTKATNSNGWTVNNDKGSWAGYYFRPGSFTYSGQAGSNDLVYGDSYSYNKWYYYSVMADRQAGVYRIYRNGILLYTKAITHPSLANNWFWLGARGNVPDGHYNGSTAHVSGYSKALTQEEILQNYHQAPIVTDGLVFASDPGNLLSYENGVGGFNSLTGSITGAVVNGTYYSPVNGGVWTYDGTNDWVYTNNYPVYNTLLSNFTVMVWIKPEYLPGIAQRVIGLGYVKQWQVELRGGSGTRVSVNYNKSSTNYFQTGGPTVSFGSWQQIGIHVDNGAVSYIYNGVKTSTAFTVVGGFDNWAQPLSIGNYNGAGDGAYLGQIGSAYIYNRTLTQAEITQNYNAQRHRFGL